MWRYVVKRILRMIPVIIGVSFLIFFIMNLAPGTYLEMQAAEEGLTAAELEALMEEYGYNDNIFVRYFRYMFNFVQGDLGNSYITGNPVLEEYMSKVPATAKLAVASMTVSVVLSLFLGIIGALKRGTLIDNGCMALSFLGLSIPNFWLGIMLMLLFTSTLHWLPSSGDQGFKSLIMPAITVGTGLTATLARTTRSSMLDVLNQDYLRTARAQGIPERQVIMKYGLRNALIPIITIAGGQFAVCLGGSVVTEKVFSWPGVGRLIVDSVSSRDVPMVTGCIILKTVTIGLVVLAVDLLYAVIDPRIKAQYAKGGKKRK